jgi:sugar phosphate isomerase/epimerase
MMDRLRRVAEIAGALGARASVFGAPTLRDPGALALEEALAIAEAFLRAIAPDYSAHGVQLCFEANPPIYQCRFVTRTEEAFELVERVNAPGIALQLDTGTIFINGEDPEIIQRFGHRIGHFHVSEPNLVPTGTAAVDHAAVAEALKASSYAHWISIEMKAVEEWRGAVRHAHDLVHSLYRGTREAA